ncbi:MAG: hypothetical protein HOP06_00870 [Methylotenera sp.]|nr:hypothetical protein [Methylotenera sp.]
MLLTPITITICSTARLVRGVVNHHQQRQLESGVEQWQAASVYTLPQWLDIMLGNAALLGLIASDTLPALTLSPIAEAYLWEQAIETCLAKHEAAALFDIRAMAKSAIEANNLMLNWQITEADINSPFITQETRQFLRWRHTFEDLCAKQHALEAARMLALQASLIEQYQLHLCKELAWPAKIILAGFDRHTPLEKHLFALLKSGGVQVEVLATTPQNNPQITNYALASRNAECRAAVAWAKQKLAENPKAQLAIISPALGNIRRELADLLDDTFHPEALLPNQCEVPRCYDFSLGLALTEYPIVQSALRLLKFAATKANMSFEDVTPILQDVYWSNAAELDARALLDAHCRKNLNASYGLDALLKQASKLQTDGANLLALLEHLTVISQFRLQNKARQLPSVWVVDFTRLLEAVGWASSLRGLSSHEYQAQQAFQKCLTEFSTLDAIFGNLSAGEAAQKLTELCNAAMFQPESKGEVHIQILGLLETPAVQLDAVWALNMNDQHWPPAVRLNPLLPAEIQRSHGTPNASSAVQGEFAHLVHARLMQSAPEVVFSYALKEDERELRASPLLDVNYLTTAEIASTQTLAEQLAKPATMQMLDDFIAPAILPPEKARGGVNLFATQALCPAWAFYQYRLGANKLETPIDGLDNMSRGSLLHKVLQLFWQDCASLSKLKAMNAEQRQSAIDAAIEQSVQSLLHEISYHIPPQVLQIERQRLSQLMQIWLEIELQRADFTVTACEQKHDFEVEGLALKLTIDRIDTLTEGGLVVIDYKTGAVVANKSWADDRIAEPQLPIYAVLALKYEQVVALAFAKIRTDETKFIGLTADENVLPEVTALTAVRSSSTFARFESWDALQEHWHTSLTNIAQEIKAGVASVTFNKESDLAYCDVRPLLRLPERMLQFEQMQARLLPVADR